MAEVSNVTGMPYYSGTWQDVRDHARTLKIGEGKIATLSQEVINKWQEYVDREIDGILHELYYVPIRYFNQMQPNGVKKKIYPGEIVALALTWVCAQVVANEFSGVDPNASEQAQTLMEESKKKLQDMVKYCKRIQGQEVKSNISRTMPPTMQPPFFPEPQF
jgi:hypothetical protein